MTRQSHCVVVVVVGGAHRFSSMWFPHHTFELGGGGSVWSQLTSSLSRDPFLKILGDTASSVVVWYQSRVSEELYLRSVKRLIVLFVPLLEAPTLPVPS